MCNRSWTLDATAAVVALLASAGRAPAQFYEYKVIGKVGQAGLTGMESGVSINDTGQVAFVGQTAGVDSGYEGIFYGDGAGAPVNVSPGMTADQINIYPTLQINNDGKIVARTQKPNPNGGFAITHIWRWDINSPDNPFAIAWGIDEETIFRSVSPNPTINNPGAVVFSGLDHNIKHLLATGLPKTWTTTVLPKSPVWPMVCDTGESAIRWGINLTDPIHLRKADLTLSATIADNPNFASLGQAPGVSTDGRVVVFAGDLSQAGATTLNTAQADWNYGAAGKLRLTPLKPGPGVFASVKTDKGRVVIRIAGVAGNDIVDPGETFNDVNKNGVFDPATENDSGLCATFPFIDSRVGVSTCTAAQRAFTVCFLAQNAQGEQGIYSSRVNLFASGTASFDLDTPGFLIVGQTTKVAEAGDTIAGLAGTVQTLGVYDPVNDRDRNDIAFYAGTSTSAGIVRARPTQVVFLDFNPVANFKLNLDSASLFGPEGMKLSAGWDGNMGTVFAEMAPNRDDLNSQSALKTIQDGVVGAVQAAYDKLTGNNTKHVNTVILGKVGQAPPTGGPFMRVYIGDGKNTNANPDATAGIATLDVFNQKMDINRLGQVPKVVPVQGSPLIFVDNLFRLSSGTFSNQNVNSPKAIPLSDTGPHKVTQANVITALANTIAHEVGHNLGLSHIDNDLDQLTMNANTSSPVNDGHPTDEMRFTQLFGVAQQPLEPTEYKFGGENSGARLANSVGSDLTEGQLARQAPPNEVLSSDKRDLFKSPISLDSPISVARAALGIVPGGNRHAEPQWVDLGSGDLATLLDQDIEIGVSDSVILIASTAGDGIDIFGVKAGFAGQTEDIDLSDALLVMSDQRIRADALDDDGEPLAQVLDIYERGQGGDEKVGSIGDPAGNDGPLAKDDSAQTDAGVAVTISVLANDTDPDGLDKAKISVVVPPPGGVAVPDPATGKIKYTPGEGFGGVDTFRYTVRDAKGAPSNEATVTITVAGGGCYSDCDASGELDLFDFLCFTNDFNGKEDYADCDQNGVFDLFDFLCFVNEFNAGC